MQGAVQMMGCGRKRKLKRGSIVPKCDHDWVLDEETSKEAGGRRHDGEAEERDLIRSPVEQFSSAPNTADRPCARLVTTCVLGEPRELVHLLARAPVPTAARANARGRFLGGGSQTSLARGGAGKVLGRVRVLERGSGRGVGRGRGSSGRREGCGGEGGSVEVVRLGRSPLLLKLVAVGRGGRVGRRDARGPL